MSSEEALVFECSGDRLTGILHLASGNASTAVVIVVGGPQYRVGSHRQFVIMARAIASAGYPVLRFDYRGMGDAGGAPRMFDNVDDDIRTALDTVFRKCPVVEQVILLGLCDAATASSIYAYSDQRVAGLILLNPWARTSQGEAKSYLRHYYLQRLFQRSFWRKVGSGKFLASRSIREFVDSLKNAKSRNPANDGMEPAQSFLERMKKGIERFQGRILLLISGRDLTALAFTDLAKDDRHWRALLDQDNISIHRFPDADHTMSVTGSLDEANNTIVSWLNDMNGRIRA